MGEIVVFEKMDRRTEMLSRLKVYYRLIGNAQQEPVSIGRALSIEIEKEPAERRSLKLSQCLATVMDGFPPGQVVKEIDVLFNPSYQIDVLKMLVEENKRKPFKVVWPGKCENGKLIYSEEGYSDYKVFDIKDYDITCII